MEIKERPILFSGEMVSGELWECTVTNPEIKKDRLFEVIGNIHENPELAGGKE